MKILLDKTPPVTTSTQTASSSLLTSDLPPDDLFSLLIAATQNSNITSDISVENDGSHAGETNHDDEQAELIPESLLQALAVKIDIQDKIPENKKNAISLNKIANQAQLMKPDVGIPDLQPGPEKLSMNIENKAQLGEFIQHSLQVKDLPDAGGQDIKPYVPAQPQYAMQALVNKQLDNKQNRDVGMEDRMPVAELKRQDTHKIQEMEILMDEESPLIDKVERAANKPQADKIDFPSIVNQVGEKTTDFVNLVSQYRQANSSQQIDTLKGAPTNSLVHTDTAAAKSEHLLDGSVEIGEPSSVDLGKMTYHVRLKIYPPELGKISARLRLENNRADLFFTAENERVSQILKQHLPDLKDQLSAAMIKVDTLNVQISSGSESFGDKDDSRNPRQTQQVTYQGEEVATIVQKQPIEKKPNKSDSMIDTYI